MCSCTTLQLWDWARAARQKAFHSGALREHISSRASKGELCEPYLHVCIQVQMNVSISMGRAWPSLDVCIQVHTHDVL
eukprot:scaffold314364_cov26-Tisochrysis_lutea.AAC.2